MNECLRKQPATDLMSVFNCIDCLLQETLRRPSGCFLLFGLMTLSETNDKTGLF